MERLRALEDPVAYVRFASVYRDFRDVGEFMASRRGAGQEEAGCRRGRSSDRRRPGGAERFMRLALREARRGLGRTSPNPAVGAVLVKGGRVVGRGHHARAGAPARRGGGHPRRRGAGARRRPLHHARALRPLRADAALQPGHPRGRGAAGLRRARATPTRW